MPRLLLPLTTTAELFTFPFTLSWPKSNSQPLSNNLMGMPLLQDWIPRHTPTPSRRLLLQLSSALQVPSFNLHFGFVYNQPECVWLAGWLATGTRFHSLSSLAPPDLSNNQVSWQNIKMHEWRPGQCCCRVFGATAALRSHGRVCTYVTRNETHWRLFGRSSSWMFTTETAFRISHRTNVASGSLTERQGKVKQDGESGLSTERNTMCVCAWCESIPIHPNWLLSGIAILSEAELSKLFGIFNPKHLTYSTTTTDWSVWVP